MESNMTVTIFNDEYRDLVKTKCNYDLLVGLLLSETDLNWDQELRLRGSSAKYIEQFEPMAYKFRLKELLDDKAKMDAIVKCAKDRTEGD